MVCIFRYGGRAIMWLELLNKLHCQETNLAEGKLNKHFENAQISHNIPTPLKYRCLQSDINTYYRLYMLINTKSSCWRVILSYTPIYKWKRKPGRLDGKANIWHSKWNFFEFIIHSLWQPTIWPSFFTSRSSGKLRRFKRIKSPHFLECTNLINLYTTGTVVFIYLMLCGRIYWSLENLMREERNGQFKAMLTNWPRFHNLTLVYKCCVNDKFWGDHIWFASPLNFLMLITKLIRGINKKS